MVLFEESLVILKHLCVRLSLVFYAVVEATTSVTLMDELAFEAYDPLWFKAPSGGLMIFYLVSLLILLASDIFEFLFIFRPIRFSLCYELFISLVFNTSFGDLCLLTLREELDY